MKLLSPWFLTILVALTCAAAESRAGFHLWQVKEAFSNADGSVQFIEMFDSFGGEVFVNGFTLTANSDGNIKTFTFPANIATTPGSMLIATTGFGSLPGGVTPDFTFSQSTTPFSESFFNPNAANLTFAFSGSGDSMTFTGAALPKDGIHSLSDAGAVGFPPRHSEYQLGRQFADEPGGEFRLGKPLHAVANRRLQWKSRGRCGRLCRLAQAPE